MAYDLSVPRARNPLIVVSIFAVIAVTTTILRLCVRRMRKMRLGPDDWFMLAALFLFSASFGIHYACVIAGGVGRDAKEVQDAAKLKLFKMLIVFELLYAFELTLIKTSIIFFYLRIFGASKSFRVSAYIVIGLLAAWSISVLLETGFLCKPFAYNWDITIPGGKCGDRKKAYMISGAMNVITDFMVMALPIPRIIHLRLKTRKKLGMVLMFSLGTFITVISIFRIVSLRDINLRNITRSLNMAFLWTTLEPCLCIINANLPMTRTFLSIVAPGVFGSTVQKTRSLNTITGGSKVVSGPFEIIDDDVEMGKLEVSEVREVERLSTSRAEDTDGDSVIYLSKAEDQRNAGAERIRY